MEDGNEQKEGTPRRFPAACSLPTYTDGREGGELSDENPEQLLIGCRPHFLSEEVGTEF